MEEITKKEIVELFNENGLNIFGKFASEIAELIADEVIELPDVLECLEPLVATIPLQLLAYHVAVCKGKNVDQPRNLAKSVTVE